MSQAATSEGPGLPCRPKQALALYQLLFQRPAGLGQLQAALSQVHEGRGCLLGLELPTMLLQMEQRRRAQEKILWDLELLTGAGLGLFWPPWAQSYGQRDQVQHTWSQHSHPSGRMGGDSEQLVNGGWSMVDSMGGEAMVTGLGIENSRLHPSHQAVDVTSQNQQLLEGGPATHSSASEPGEARSDADTRLESPTIPAEAAPGGLEKPNLTTVSSFKESGDSEVKGEETNQAESTIQRPHKPTSRSQQGRKLTQEAPGTSDLASQGLPAPQDPSKGLGSSMRAETQILLGIDPSQGQQEKEPQGQSGQSPQGHRRTTPQSEDKGASHSQRENSLKCPRKQAPPAQFGKGNNTPQALEVAQGEVTVQRPERGNLPAHPRDSGRSSGKQIPQPREPGSSGFRGRTPKLMQELTAVAKLGAAPESPSEPLPALRPSALSRLSESRMSRGTEASGPQELPAAVPGRSPSPVGEVGDARLPGSLGEQRGGPGGPRTSKAAWPAPRGGEEEQPESALRRLLELHRAAGRRRRRDREQQRLRVLERLRIVGSRHRRVHPLGLSPSTAQLPPQEDAAGRRRALRERLHQVHLERTRRLRALGARNTQNFQELLSPGAEEPAPGD